MSANPRAGRLAGKTIIVTGGGAATDHPGTGSAMSILFARHGATVHVLDHDRDRADATVGAIAAEGGDACTEVADVRDEAACRAAVERVLAARGRIDGLVNNVGIAGGGSVLQTDVDTWDEVLAVNARSVLLMSKAVLPGMVAQRSGAIVNIASIAALLPNGIVAYSASKAAMLSLTRELAVEYGRDGVRANAICPGHIVAPMSRDRSAEMLERRRRAAPLGIDGTPWDVAWTALFLMSDEARFVTGAVVPVDGGLTEVAPLSAYRLFNE